MTVVTRQYAISAFVFSVFIYVSASFLDVEEFKFGTYDVVIMKTPVMKTKSLPAFTLPLVSKHGQEYWCHLPNETDILQSQKFAAESVTTTPPNNTEITLALKPLLSDPCFTLNRGWWTYEVCLRKHIVQYHEDEETKTHQSISYLGYFESDYDWSSSDPKDDERRLRHHSQSYVNGSFCDLSQAARRATVRYRCTTTTFVERLLNVEEPESCVYVLTLETYRVCFHPWLKELVKPPPLELYCQPALSDLQFQQYELKETEKKRKLQENKRRAEFRKVLLLARRMRGEYARVHLLAHRSYRVRNWQQRVLIEPLRHFWTFLNEKLPNIDFISREQAQADIDLDDKKAVNMRDMLQRQEEQVEEIESNLKELQRMPTSTQINLKLFQANLLQLSEGVERLRTTIEMHEAVRLFTQTNHKHKLQLRETVYMYSSDPFFYLTDGLELQKTVLQYLEEVNVLAQRVQQLSAESAELTSDFLKASKAEGPPSQRTLGTISDPENTPHKQGKPIRAREIAQEIREKTKEFETLIKTLQAKTDLFRASKKTNLIIGSAIIPGERNSPLPPPKWRSLSAASEEDVEGLIFLPSVSSSSEMADEESDLVDELLNNKLFSALPDTWHKTLRHKLLTFARIANERLDDEENSAAAAEAMKSFLPSGKLQVRLFEEDGDSVDLNSLIQKFSNGELPDTNQKKSPVEDVSGEGVQSTTKDKDIDTAEKSPAPVKEASNPPGMIKIMFYRSDLNQKDKDKQTANEKAYGVKFGDQNPPLPEG